MVLITDLEQGGDCQFRKLLNVVSEDVIADDLCAWLKLIIPAVLSSSIPNAVEVKAFSIRLLFKLITITNL